MIRPDELYRTPDGFNLRVEPDDYFQACMLLGIYEPVMGQVIDRFADAGSVVLDIGAHIGYFTLMLSRRVGPAGAVHAFDPDPRAARRIREHVEMNGADNVAVNQSAASEADGTIDLGITAQLGWASVRQGVAAREVIAVRAVRIDDYLLRNGVDPARVSLIKIDVEGGELEALRGMARTLARMSGVVIVEFFPARMRDQGDDPDDLLKLMADVGYVPQAVRDTSSGLTIRPAGPEDAGDLLFLKSL